MVIFAPLKNQGKDIMLNDHHYDNASQNPIAEISAEEFIYRIENYYSSSYNPIQKKYVKEWLEPRSERRLALVLVELLKIFSMSWGKPPGIAEFEKADKIVLTERSFDLRHPKPRIPEKKWEPMTPEQEKENEGVMRNLRAQLEGKIEETSLTVQPHNQRSLSPLPKLLPETPKQKKEREKMLKKSRAQWATLQKEEEDLKNKF